MMLTCRSVQLTRRAQLRRLGSHLVLLPRRCLLRSFQRSLCCLYFSPIPTPSIHRLLPPLAASCQSRRCGWRSKLDARRRLKEDEWWLERRETKREQLRGLHALYEELLTWRASLPFLGDVVRPLQGEERVVRVSYAVREL
jgi:hypothetical protein